MSDRVVYVTAGTKGVGHLVRGIAIGRALNRAGFSGSYHVVTPVAPPPAMVPIANSHGLEVCEIDVAVVLNESRVDESALAKKLISLRADLLIVDLFWAPVLHILGKLDCPAWLLVRSCPPVWLHGNQSIPFRQADYQRIIGIEPISNQRIAEHIDPIVIANPDEARTRLQLAECFKVDPAAQITVVTHAGLPGEIDLVAPQDSQAKVASGSIVYADMFETEAPFPLAPWLYPADQVFCSAGYNSYWEARWLGYAERSTFTPFQRQIDDPFWRLNHCADYTMKSNGADTLAASIISG